MEYKKINLIDNRNLSLDKYSEEMETCNECNIEAIVDTCNKCGNGVCRSDNCCLSFPDRYNTTFIICNGCYSPPINSICWRRVINIAIVIITALQVAL